MKKEDIEFLNELKEELLTQETDGQANPRFWVVREVIKRPTSEEYSDGYVIFDCDGQCEFANEEEFRKHLIDEEYYTEEELQDVWDDELVEYANKKEYRYQYHYYETLYKVCENTMFLTKRECKEHIKANGYHYDEPHSYAMTAWRSPQVERLIEIITKTDWEIN